MRSLFLIASLVLALAACGQESATTTPTAAQSTAPSTQPTTPPATAPMQAYRAGVHYMELPEAYRVDDPSKIEVAEVFWYGCSHCFQFEPLLQAWKKDLPADVNLVLVPALWNSAMEIHARMYYTAKNLNLVEKTHLHVFTLMNIDRKPFTTPEEAADFYASMGADRDAVMKELMSFGVTSQIKQASARARGYKITGTPELVVQGKYRVVTTADVKQADMLKVVNFLVEKVRQEQFAARPTAN